jgi:hypothetical protein
MNANNNNNIKENRMSNIKDTLQKLAEDIESLTSYDQLEDFVMIAEMDHEEGDRVLTMQDRRVIKAYDKLTDLICLMERIAKK